jgi:hypothetical protein
MNLPRTLPLMERTTLRARLVAIVVGTALLALIPAVAGANERSTLDLSSWTPISEGSEIVGGTRTVTVTNFTEEPVDGIVFDLGTNPCDCSMASATATQGSASGSDWSIGRLEPGETVTLTVSYVRSERASAPRGQTRPPDGAALIAAAVFGSLGIVVLDRRRRVVTRAV